MGLRNLYKVFRETRNAAREQATLAVTGDSARAAEVAALLGAQRGVRGAEVILAVRDGGATISGKAVEDPGEIPLSSKGGESLLEELTPRIVLALDEDYLVALAKGYPPLRRAVCEDGARGKDGAQHSGRLRGGALDGPGARAPRGARRRFRAKGPEPSGRKTRAFWGMGGLRGHRLRRHRDDGPGQYPLLRTRRPAGGRERDGQHQGPRPQGG